MNTSVVRTYSELIKLDTFEERLRYLELKDRYVGDETFGHDRYLNQMLYSSDRWRKLRNEIIVRDNGWELGLRDYVIEGHIYIHHMNPITREDILSHNPDIFDPEYLISVSHKVHNIIHYGNGSAYFSEVVERKPFDTCPWR